MAVAREKRISPEIRLSIKLSKGKDGYVVAECPDIPGCVTQGRNREEALTNLNDVVRTALALIVREWMSKARKGHRRTARSADQELILKFVQVA